MILWRYVIKFIVETDFSSTLKNIKSHHVEEYLTDMKQVYICYSRRFKVGWWEVQKRENLFCDLQGEAHSKKLVAEQWMGERILLWSRNVLLQCMKEPTRGNWRIWNSNMTEVGRKLKHLPNMGRRTDPGKKMMEFWFIW